MDWNIPQAQPPGNPGYPQPGSEWGSNLAQPSAPPQMSISYFEFSSIYQALVGALAEYSQQYIKGERNLDPDKLSKVMFLCGLAQGLTLSQP